MAWGDVITQNVNGVFRDSAGQIPLPPRNRSGAAMMYVPVLAGLAWAYYENKKKGKTVTSAAFRGAIVSGVVFAILLVLTRNRR
jgi:hypothetical protein